MSARIGDLLVKDGIIKQEQLTRALEVTRPIFCTNRSESLHRSLGL